MRKNLPFFAWLCILFTFISLCSCTNNGSGANDCFKTKEDSIAFAKNVYRIYALGGEEVLITASFSKNNMNAAGVEKFDPVDWEYVKRYASNYIKNPLFNGTKGFTIDERGLRLIKGNPNYKQLFIHLGKYTDDPNIRNDYTLLILPMDANRKFIHKGVANRGANESGNNNYDYLDPCPVVCPDEPEP